jgi:hypothetical protein
VRKFRPVRILLGVIGLGVGVVGVLALREATLSTHEPVTGREMEVVVSAKTKGGETNQTLPEMVEAQLLACRLEVQSDLAGPVEPLADGRFRAVLVPSLDETDRRQFGGCVEDWIVDHVQLDLIHLTEIR